MIVSSYVASYALIITRNSLLYGLYFVECFYRYESD